MDDLTNVKADGALGRVLQWRPLLASAAVVLVAVLMAVAISHLVREVSYGEVVDALRATSAGQLAAAVLFTAASFMLLSLYDVSALAYVGRKLPYRVVGLAAFCAYAVSNTAGFGPLTGGAIRYRFFAPLGFEPEDIGRIVAFVTASFGIGLVAVTGLGLVAAAGDVAGYLGVPDSLLRIAGALVLAMIAGAVAVAARRRGAVTVGRTTLQLPRPGLMLRQLMVTLLDVSASAAVLWVLLPGSAIDLPGFIAIYAIAVGLGVLSHVPGGLGVFETVIVAAVGGNIPVHEVLGALVLYRAVYHGLPLLLAGLIVAAVELRRIAMGAAVTRAAAAVAPLAPPVLGALTLLLGVMLIFSGVTPALNSRLDVLAQHVPLPFIEGAHFLASVLGLGLMVASRGLAYRLDGAWWAACMMTGLAIVLSLVKAIAATEAGLLILLLAALLASRRQFDRPASLLHQALRPGWLAAVAVVLITATAILFFVYRDVEYGHDLWWQFEFSAEAPRSLRALVGAALVSGVLAGAALLRPARSANERPSQQDLDRAVAITARQSSVDADLVRMGDKSIMFSDVGDAFIMYARQGRSWIALFDPVGAPAAWPELVWRFVEAAQREGGRAVFYQVGPDALSLYVDAGLRAFKLGEDAQVALPGFDLKGASKASLRHALNRGIREGLEFAILSPDEVGGQMDRLQEISDSWLAHHKAREKRFSLGAFDRNYVGAQPVAVLRRDGAIVAFATILMTELREEVSIDLMRFGPAAPGGAMEYLFIRLMEHYRDAGYQWFNLGMAPLSGFSESPAAPAWHRIGAAIFEHGERFYNFRGLRAFKAKYQPVWRPRYMAVSGSPTLALADATILIGGGLKGVVGK
ncbi:bifunctional lysylphosphatidylglycerol flippase/synthetase MprF [Iodidimonas sp. SYSU 1G8]|uniref:bifunctional lysylphosphatidylglycerol flippase/synthetase MprF n=1 Tax=Iodidimonas sp. SYSU 1G8 TaxID=3133967 RepID=UPI0031FF39DE